MKPIIIFFHCLLLLGVGPGAGFSLTAQTALTIEDTLYVSGANALFVEGDLSNEITGVLAAPGDIILTGDWVNLGAYRSDGQGRVRMEGSSLSLMSGAMTGNDAFHHLEISKTPGQLVQLKQDLQVRDSLLLNGGILHTTNREVFVSSTAPGIIRGHSLPGAATDDRYVQGNLRRSISSTNVFYDFPVGAAVAQGGYQLLRLNPTSLNGAQQILVDYQASHAYVAPMTSECGATFDCLLTDHGQWAITPSAGTPAYDAILVPRNFTSNCGGGSYTILTGGSLQGAACTGFSGSLDPVLGTPILRKGLSSLAPMVITGSAASFPVEWLSFEAVKQGSTAQLSWQTGMEENNAFFEIQRSADGGQFEPIGRVQSQGDSPTGFAYEFLDAAPLIGRNVYRLQQVDLDGGFSYSPLRELWFETAAASVWPNPFHEYLQIRTPQPETNLRLTNMLGQVIYENKLDTAGEHALALTGLPEGTYILQLLAKGQVLLSQRLTCIH